MKTLKLNENNDLDITGNTFSIIQDEDEIAQKLQLTLSIKKGEWFRDTNSGLEHSNILGKNFDAEKARIDVIEALRQDSRVEEIEFLDVSPNREERQATIAFRLTTSVGTVEGEVII